jgi:hypothetical protein
LWEGRRRKKKGKKVEKREDGGEWRRVSGPWARGCTEI